MEMLPNSSIPLPRARFIGCPCRTWVKFWQTGGDGITVNMKNECLKFILIFSSIIQHIFHVTRANAALSDFRIIVDKSKTGQLKSSFGWRVPSGLLAFYFTRKSMRMLIQFRV